MLSEVSLNRVRAGSYKCPFVMLQCGTIRCNALVDSGSARCLISNNFFDKLRCQGLVLSTEETNLQCLTASRVVLPVDMVASLHFKIEGFSWTWSFLVSSVLGLDCI